MPALALSGIKKGKVRSAIRMVLHGEPKVGKSSFAEKAPEPIYLSLDDGTNDLDVARIPFKWRDGTERTVPETWDDILGAVRMIARGGHPYKTLVIDPFNWAEMLLHKHLCDSRGWSDIEAPGYGKGYAIAATEWAKFLALLDIVIAKGIHVILIAHTAVTSVQNIGGEDYKQSSLPLDKKTSVRTVGWADCILFAEFDVSVKKKKGELRATATMTDKRFLRTQPSAAWKAGNRWSLPDPLPLDWATFYAHYERTLGDDASETISEIRMLAQELDAEGKARAEAAIAKLGKDKRRLVELLNRVREACAKEVEEEPAHPAHAAETPVTPTEPAKELLTSDPWELSKLSNSATTADRIAELWNAVQGIGEDRAMLWAHLQQRATHLGVAMPEMPQARPTPSRPVEAPPSMAPADIRARAIAEVREQMRTAPTVYEVKKLSARIPDLNLDEPTRLDFLEVYKVRIRELTAPPASQVQGAA